MSFNRYFRAWLILSALSVGLMTAGLGDDRKQNEHDRIRAALERHEVMPLTQILGIALQRVPGNVIEVELEDDDGFIYSIKILDRNGQVHKLKIDARNGTVLRVKTADPD